mmetsp:Transcript_16142/g.32676  ORF Transcript_16142/g.32676 Transcript_16142/m.32676 type:complete len:361 (-) Transcript_16142:1509-2591(-)
MTPELWAIALKEDTVRAGPNEREIIVATPRSEVLLVAVDTNQLEIFRKAIYVALTRRIQHFYDIGQPIGEGAFATVHLARGRITGKSYAIKLVDKSEPQDKCYILAEINVIKSVCHPNIVRTYDLFNTKRILYFVMEYCEGGELFDVIADAGRFSELNASQVMRSIVKGVQYLHLHDIVHRDIKPENVLCVDQEWPLQVKICDFGLAGFIRDAGLESSLIGTPGYVAPEIVTHQPYGAAVDLWSCGVLLYIMLSGKMPFFGRTDQECLKRIAEGRYTFPEKEWGNISADAKSLVKGLLQIDPKKRLTARACLVHRWLDSNQVSDEPIPNDLSGIHSSQRKFRKAVHAVMTIGRMKGVVGS